jgi:hypothetical protein
LCTHLGKPWSCRRSSKTVKKADCAATRCKKLELGSPQALSPRWGASRTISSKFYAGTLITDDYRLADRCEQLAAAIFNSDAELAEVPTPTNENPSYVSSNYL